MWRADTNDEGRRGSADSRRRQARPPAAPARINLLDHDGTVHTRPACQRVSRLMGVSLHLGLLCHRDIQTYQASLRLTEPCRGSSTRARRVPLGSASARRDLQRLAKSGIASARRDLQRLANPGIARQLGGHLVVHSVTPACQRTRREALPQRKWEVPIADNHPPRPALVSLSP